MQATMQFPGQGKFRTATQRRYVLVRWSLHYDKADIVKRSDTLATLTQHRSKIARYDVDVRVFDTVTRQVVA